MIKNTMEPKNIELQLTAPIGPLPMRIKSIAPHLVTLIDDEWNLKPGELVSIKLRLDERVLFELFGKVAEISPPEASILLMATTPGFVPWLKRIERMGYINLKSETKSLSQPIVGLGWQRPTDPSSFKN